MLFDDLYKKYMSEGKESHLKGAVKDDEEHIDALKKDEKEDRDDLKEGKECPECGEYPCVCDDEKEVVKEGNLPKKYINQAKDAKGKSEEKVKKVMKDIDDEKETKEEKEGIKESTIKHLKEGRAVQDAYKQILYGKK